jgi:hypothetical protein
MPNLMGRLLNREKENLEVFYTRTNRGNRIACMFVKCSPNARYGTGTKPDTGTVRYRYRYR